MVTERTTSPSEPRVTNAPVAATPRPRSRVSATWIAICIVVVVTVLLIVFMLQNNQPVTLSLFGWHGEAPLSVALLIAGVGVGLVMLVVGSLRIGQLRRRLAAAQASAPEPDRSDESR